MFSPELPLNHTSGLSGSHVSLPNHKHEKPGSIRLYRMTDRVAVEKIIREAEDELPIQHASKLNIGRTVRYWLEDGYARAGFYLFDLCNEVVGLVGFTPLEIGFGEVCQLQPLFLRANLRGKGYGQQLLDHTINGARESGYRRCYLELSAHLEDAVRLVENYGFYKMPASPRQGYPHDPSIRHYMKYIF
ncbi:GNAT family N-acetyltransferase [Roseivirga sp. BDSF3-8]|uniref:GNAT family N-acetyltransferase n=1 Tax=Roseivirga sp. BDSF3-8 TaxID=3241598 RepID=UPI0035323C4F